MSSEPSITGGVATAEPSTARDRAEANRRALEAAFNRGDFEPVRALTSDQAVSHDPSLPPDLQALRGPEPFIRQVTTYRAAFPDLEFVIEDTIAEGERVAVRWSAHGTHRGRLRGFAPTGVRATSTGISISRWKGGRIAEVWVEWDNLGLARQIGAAPPEGSLPDRLATGAQQLVARWRRRRSGG